MFDSVCDNDYDKESCSYKIKNWRTNNIKTTCSFFWTHKFKKKSRTFHLARSLVLFSFFVEILVLMFIQFCHPKLKFLLSLPSWNNSFLLSFSLAKLQKCSFLLVPVNENIPDYYNMATSRHHTNDIQLNIFHHFSDRFRCFQPFFGTITF